MGYISLDCMHTFWSVEGNQCTHSKPAPTLGEHPNSQQKGPRTVPLRDRLPPLATVQLQVLQNVTRHLFLL